jgi:hypothetical protein
MCQSATIITLRSRLKFFFLDFFIDDIFVLLRASQTGPLEETVGQAPGQHWEFKGSGRSERDRDRENESGKLSAFERTLGVVVEARYIG